MSVEHTSEPSAELLELILFSLDHGIESVRGGGPLIPFLATMGSGRPKLARFVAESTERSREMLEQAAGELAADVNLYALAVDGCLRGETGEPCDAIIVEAGQRGAGPAFLFAQIYQPKDVSQDLQVVGKPTLVGEAANRLA